MSARRAFPAPTMDDFDAIQVETLTTYSDDYVVGVIAKGSRNPLQEDDAINALVAAGVKPDQLRSDLRHLMARAAGTAAKRTLELALAFLVGWGVLGLVGHASLIGG